MNRSTRLAAASVATLAAAISAHHAQAATFVKFTFVGDVVGREGDNPDHIWNHVQIGDPVSFSYIIDIDQPDQAVSPFLGVYDIEWAELSFGGIPVVAEEFGRFRVDLTGSNGNDTVDIPLPDVGAWQPQDGAVFYLIGFDNLPDDSIPIDFELDSFFAHGIQYGDFTSFGLDSSFTSYSYQIIPSPAAAWLLGTILFSRGRRRTAARPSIQGLHQ